MPTVASPHMKIIVNCGPCEAFIGTCLASLKSQSHRNWKALVTVDPCGDETEKAAATARDGDERIAITTNLQRLYAMENTVRAIARSGADDEDVFVVLDGDDWFHTTNALETIAAAYRKHDCWMTYGSWTAGPDGLPGCWPAYPDGGRAFRYLRWLATAVRTWKKWLWDRIDDADLRDEDGSYFRVTEDMAIMFPLLEMCGTERAHHIPTPLMWYNGTHAFTCAKTKRTEAHRNTFVIRNRPQYACLTAKPG